MPDTINIITSESENASYEILAGFFELIGTLPVKSIQYPIGKIYKNKSFTTDCILDIKKETKLTDSKESFSIKDKELPVLLKAANSILPEQQVLTLLAKVYIESGLAQQYLLTKFFYNPTEERLIKCRNVFRAAIYILEKIEDKNILLNNRYRYFLISCKNQDNILSEKLKLYDRQRNIWDLPYKATKLMDEAFEVAESGFWQGYVLVGNICDESWQYYSDSLVFYQKALGKNKLWDAEIHERLGRYYKKIEDDPQTALKHYNIAYNGAPWNYIYLYRKANIDFELHNISGAEDMFSQISIQLHDEIDNNDLTPFQCNLLIRSFRQRQKLHYIWTNEQKIAAYMDKNVQRIIDMIDTNVFFDKFFNVPDKPDWPKQEKVSLQLALKNM